MIQVRYRPQVCRSKHARTFLYPCTRCGYCCVDKICLLAWICGHPLNVTPCRFLDIGAEQATCTVLKVMPQIKDLVGMWDKGCCMKGRVLDRKTGKEIPWGPLPADTKRAFAVQGYVRRELENKLGATLKGQPPRQGVDSGIESEEDNSR